MKDKSQKISLLLRADRIINGRLAATLRINDKSLIKMALEAASCLKPMNITILVPQSREDSLLEDIPNKDVMIKTEISSLDEYSVILDAAYIYNIKKLRKGLDPDKAVIWRIDSEEDAKYAQDEINKEDLYPLSRYYLRPWALLLAKYLSKFKITANQVTLISFSCGILSAAFLLFSNFISNALSGISLWLYMFFDHVDGRLARLKKEQSSFGSYLDTITGLIAWNLVFLAISARLYIQTKNPLFLFLGAVYMFGDYIFNYSILSKQFSSVNQATSWDNISIPNNSRTNLNTVKKIFSFLDDMDIRVHFTILFIFIGKPIYPFAYHLIYINLRWVLNISNEFLKHRKREKVK